MANILTRRESRGISSLQLSANQQKIDQIDQALPERISDVPSFAAVLSGGLAYRYGKLALLGNPIAAKAPALFRSLAPAGGLAAEVSVYRGVHHGLKPELPSNTWLADFFNFGALKIFGKAAEGQNPLFANFLQDSAMLAGQDITALLGLSTAPQGNFLDRFIEAQAFNVQMKLGLSWMHQASGGRILAHEKSLDLFLDSSQNPAFASSSFHFPEESISRMAGVKLDDLGFPILTSDPPPAPRGPSPKYSRYFWKFHDEDRSLFTPLSNYAGFGELAVSRAFGTARIAADGVSVLHFAAMRPVEMKDYQSKHAFAHVLQAYEGMMRERYEEKKDRFSSYAMLLWHFFLKQKNDPLAEELHSIAAEVVRQDPRFANFVVQEGDITPFLRRFLSSPEAVDKDSQIEFCARTAEEFLGRIYEKYGIDPLLFALRLQDQMIAGYYLSTPSVSDLHLAAFQLGRDDSGKATDYVNHVAAIQRAWTIDIFQSLQREMPWRHRYAAFAPGKIAASGALYTSYYKGERPEDLNDLYYGLRQSDLPAEQKQALLGEVLRRMLPMLRAIDADPNTLLLPLPSGSFPTYELAGLLAEQSSLPALIDAWQPRPPEYGAGVEGKTLARKIELVGRYLKLKTASMNSIKGKNIVLVDDNVTDSATFLMAQIALFRAGAGSVRLLSLTQTIRNAEDLRGFSPYTP